jgi:molecular chaperone GrpE
MTKSTKTDQQIKDLTDNWKRALADYQNLLRRVEHDKKDFQKLSNANLVARLLPCLDIVELSAIHTDDLGIQMAAKQFHQALVDEGLEIISPEIGSAFNPREHECSEIVSGELENSIAELILKGYKIGDYILRPAKVKVFKSQDKIST